MLNKKNNLNYSFKWDILWSKLKVSISLKDWLINYCMNIMDVTEVIKLFNAIWSEPKKRHSELIR